MKKLLNYNPHWEAEHIDLHLKFRAQWIAASHESDMGKRRVIKDDCYATLGSMRLARMRQFETPTHVARKVLRTVALRARKRGIRDMWLFMPGPEHFTTLPQLREFLKNADRLLNWTDLNNRTVQKMMWECGVSERPKTNMGVLTLGNAADTQAISAKLVPTLSV